MLKIFNWIKSSCISEFTTFHHRNFRQLNSSLCALALGFLSWVKSNSLFFFRPRLITALWVFWIFTIVCNPFLHLMWNLSFQCAKWDKGSNSLRCSTLYLSQYITFLEAHKYIPTEVPNTHMQLFVKDFISRESLWGTQPGYYFTYQISREQFYYLKFERRKQNMFQTYQYKPFFSEFIKAQCTYWTLNIPN